MADIRGNAKDRMLKTLSIARESRENNSSSSSTSSRELEESTLTPTVQRKHDQEENLRLTSKVSFLERKIKNQKDELESIEEDRHRLNDNMTKMQTRVRNYENELERLRNENAKLKNELHNPTGTSEGGIEKLRDNITSLRKENELLKEKIHNGIQKTRSDDDLRAENDHLRQKIRSIQSKWNDFIMEIQMTTNDE